MGIVMAMVVPMILGAREVVQSDQARTQVNQNLRGGADLIGADVRVAGERFPPSQTIGIPPIEITQGANGAPDQIRLRRNLWDGTLPVCERLNGTTRNITVYKLPAWLLIPPGSGFPECGNPLDANLWPINLNAVRALADTIGVGGVLMGYVHDPSEPFGEFIEFTVPDNANVTGLIRRTTNSALAGDYRRGDRPRVYVMTERRYRVANGVLELIRDGDVAGALRAVADVVNLQASYVMANGQVVGAIPNGQTWRDVTAVEVTLTTRSDLDGETEENSITSRYFPRNALSR
jgi:hypothetical protein